MPQLDHPKSQTLGDQVEGKQLIFNLGKASSLGQLGSLLHYSQKFGTANLSSMCSNIGLAWRDATAELGMAKNHQLNGRSREQKNRQRDAQKRQNFCANPSIISWDIDR